MTTKAAEAARRWRARHPERDKQSRAAWKANNTASYIYQRAKSRALRRGLDFAITPEWVAERIAVGLCEVSGIPFTLDLGSVNAPNPWSPTIDRVDSSIGYLPGNCRMVVWVYNAAKNSWSDEVVMRLARALTEVVE